MVLVRMYVKQCTYHSSMDFSSTSSIIDQHLHTEELCLALYLESQVVPTLEVPAQFQLEQLS